jgi:hypothetical protein
MSFLKKLAERTKTVADAAAAAYHNIRVDEVARDERMAICHACPHFIKATTTCTRCGCFMAAKTYLASANCPINKWPVITIKSDI